MAKGFFTAVLERPHAGGRAYVYIGVPSKSEFKKIPLPITDHRQPRPGAPAQDLLTKSGEMTTGMDLAPIAGGPIVVIFQHWLEGAQP